MPPTSALYQQLATYFGAKLGRPVELVQGKTYAEINDLLKSGEVTVAIVCTNPYLQGRDDFGMELIAAPQVDGDVVYYSLLIVNRNSTAASLGDHRGTSFAFSDPLSNSGRLAPIYQLALRGRNPESFFSQTIFTYSHDSSIRAERFLRPNGPQIWGLAALGYISQSSHTRYDATSDVRDTWGVP